MNLTDYITREIDDLNLFEAVWQKKHEDDPRGYPLRMNDADWRDQFERWQNACAEKYNDGEITDFE
jgi:hypothetical protein